MKDNHSKKTIRIILDLAIILIIIAVFLNFYLIIQNKIIQKKLYVNYFGYTFFIVDSSSMYDTLKENDLVIVKITNDVELNDIISYEEDGNIITHRLIKKEGDTFITKGDFNNYQDKPIKKEQIIGKVISIKRNVGIWKKIFSQKKIIIPIIIEIIILAIIII